jgi:arylsulfatase A-like enzyme
MLGATRPRPTRRGLRRRQHALRCAIALGVAICTAGCGDAPTATTGKPPNLLLVTIDTLRADRLACYGGPSDTGAYLCSLGDAGTRFAWAFATAPYTAPSVASILTGLYASSHGVRQTATSYLPGDVETLPELLRDGGYRTAAFVSNPVLERSRQLDQGFEVFDQRMPRQERNRPGFVERDARSTTDAALAWAQMNAQTPWFLWVHYQDPHGPYDPPGAPPEVDAPEDDPLPLLAGDESGFGGIPAYQALPGVFTREAYERRYRAEIRYLEAHLQRLVVGLDRLGEPPSVLLTADHGEAFGEDGYYFAHGHSVGLDQIRVPLLWRPATATPPTVVAAPVTLVDVAPTLLAAAGLPIPEGWQGRPLPLDGADGEATEQRTVFAEHGQRAAIVSGDRYYARDHGAYDGDPEDEDEAPDGGSFPPRRVHLAADGRGSAYQLAEPKGEDAALERELVRFLTDAARRNAGASHETVSEELRTRLRALGYSD